MSSTMNESTVNSIVQYVKHKYVHQTKLIYQIFIYNLREIVLWREM